MVLEAAESCVGADASAKKDEAAPARASEGTGLPSSAISGLCITIHNRQAGRRRTRDMPTDASLGSAGSSSA